MGPPDPKHPCLAPPSVLLYPSLPASVLPSFPHSLPLSLPSFSILGGSLLNSSLQLFILKHLDHFIKAWWSFPWPGVLPWLLLRDGLPQSHLGRLLKRQVPNPKHCKSNSSSQQSFKYLEAIITLSPRLYFSKSIMPFQSFFSHARYLTPYVK